MFKEKIKFYRDKAVELRESADQYQTAEARDVFNRLADSYERLASELARLFPSE